MLSKRLSSLIAVGALPASIISMVGDFFSSVGGWRVALVLGLLSLLLAALTWGWAATGGLSRKSAFWIQWIQKDTDLAWISEARRPRDFHLVHVFLIFGVISLVMSSVSHAKAAEGGAVASQVPKVRAWQDELGLLNSIDSKVGAIAVTSERIYDEVRQNKKETSSDPRKELSNLGLEWKSHVFQEAVKSSDLRVVGLFVDVGVLPGNSASVFKEAVRTDNEEVYKLLLSRELAISPDICIDVGLESVLYKRTSSGQRKFLRDLCGNDKVIDILSSKIQSFEQEYFKKEALFNEWRQLIRSGDMGAKRSYDICLEIRASAGDCMLAVPSLDRNSSIESFAPAKGGLLQLESLAQLLGEK